MTLNPDPLHVPEEERAETRRSGCSYSVFGYLMLAVLVAWWLR